jgi:hypothetical protein
VRAGGLTGTAAADAAVDVRAPVGGAVGPGWSRAVVSRAVVSTAPSPVTSGALLATAAVALPVELTRRVDGRGALLPARARRGVVTSPDPFVWVLLVSSPTARLFPTAPVPCSAQ